MFDTITLTNWLIMILSCAAVLYGVVQIKQRPQNIENKRTMMVFIVLALAMGLLTWFVDVKRTQYEQKILRDLTSTNNEMLQYKNKVKELTGDN